MDAEKLTTESSVLTEPERPVAEKKKQRGKPMSRGTDNLISTVLMILYIALTGVVYKWVSESIAAGSISQQLAFFINIALFIGLGLVVFFATRTGDGKTVYRVNWFSIFLVLVPVVAFLAAVVMAKVFAMDIPFVDTIFTNYSSPFYLAMTLFGYCIPYSFISGFEKKVEEPEVHYDPVFGAADEEAPAEATTTKTSDEPTQPEISE